MVVVWAEWLEVCGEPRNEGSYFLPIPMSAQTPHPYVDPNDAGASATAIGHQRRAPKIQLTQNSLQCRNISRNLGTYNVENTGGARKCETSKTKVVEPTKKEIEAFTQL